MSSYRSAVRPPVRALVGAADALLPGALPASRALTKRSLWGALPATPAPRPDDVKRLALTVDLDYQADTDALPGLVELVGRQDARMSVVSVGALVDLDPGPYERALAAGHELVNHTLTHPDNPVLNAREEFWHLSTARMTEEVGGAQEVFDRRLGLRPRGFRTPHFKDAHRLTQVLGSFPELAYVSSVLATRSPLGASPYLASRAALAGEDLSTAFAAADAAADSTVLQIPLTACPAHRWSPFCSWHGIRAGAAAGSGAGLHPLPEWAALWRRMLAGADQDGLVVVYLDPQDLMRDADTVATFSAMLETARGSGWTITTLADVEQAYRPMMTTAAA